MSDEEVVMTPTKKGGTTHIRIEKRKKLDFSGDDQTVHVAGGQHRGLVVNKQISDDTDLGQPQLQIGFNCFLVDQKTEKRVVESRRLKFWYVEDTGYLDQVTTAYEFFKELVQPANFPRDYVGFIKKCMKQMQKSEYKLAKKIDLEIRQLSDQEAPLTPGSNVDDFFGIAKEDKRPIEEIVREKILQVLESAYPNVLEVEDLVRITAADEAIINQQLEELKAKNLVREMENGKVVRHVLEDDKTETEVQMVNQMPRIAANQQPTIAIITANYCEKLAVDAMMDNKTTFVKYKTEGESNVYTVGFIGEHKCVSTKLPQIGQSRAAQISSGNTTTRLLGTFQNIEHVFVVGVAGGVPHYTNFYKHVRLGDIVISCCNDNGYFYYHVDKILEDKEGKIQYKKRTWSPRDMSLQRVAEKIEENCTRKPEKAPWERFIHEGQELLEKQEADFNRPPKESDRLYMSIGEENVIEVQHPDRPEGAVIRENVPTVRFGVVGSGRPITKNDNTRLEFAHNYGITCFDSEYDQVIESIVGNRKDSFMFIRGIADYNDGSKNKEWQPYASLAAAAMMKTIVKMISNPYLSEDDD